VSCAPGDVALPFEGADDQSSALVGQGVVTPGTHLVEWLQAMVDEEMADRGQITGAKLDGPLALDNAISPEAAAIKKIVSPVAGRATVLVVPDLEAGNMLAKSLSFLADADATVRHVKPEQGVPLGFLFEIYL